MGMEMVKAIQVEDRTEMEMETEMETEMEMAMATAMVIQVTVQTLTDHSIPRTQMGCQVHNSKTN